MVDKELKRLKVLADQENDRISELQRKNEVEVACPICLEILPAICMEGRELERHMACCGVRYHKQCMANWEMRREKNPTVRFGACFHCRRSVSDSSDKSKMIFLEEMILTGSTVSKANALRGLGDAYFTPS